MKLNKGGGCVSSRPKPSKPASSKLICLVRSGGGEKWWDIHNMRQKNETEKEI